MKNVLRYFFALGSTLFLIACASKNTSITQQAPSFLPNYSLLKQVPGPKNTELYVYKNPSVNVNDYHAAIVEPVALAEPSSNKKEVSAEEIENARANIQAGIQKIVRRKVQLTQTPGPDVCRLSVAITGASFQAEDFKPWNIIPISAAIKLASMATDTDSKKPMLVIEIKVVDSQNGQLLKEVVSTIQGESFRGQPQAIAHTFAQLANTWVEQALQYSAALN